MPDIQAFLAILLSNTISLFLAVFTLLLLAIFSLYFQQSLARTSLVLAALALFTTTIFSALRTIDVLAQTTGAFLPCDLVGWALTSCTLLVSFTLAFMAVNLYAAFISGVKGLRIWWIIVLIIIVSIGIPAPAWWADKYHWNDIQQECTMYAGTTEDLLWMAATLHAWVALCVVICVLAAIRIILELSPRKVEKQPAALQRMSFVPAANANDPNARSQFAEFEARRQKRAKFRADITRFASRVLIYVYIFTFVQICRLAKDAIVFFYPQETDIVRYAVLVVLVIYGLQGAFFAIAVYYDPSMQDARECVRKDWVWRYLRDRDDRLSGGMLEKHSESPQLSVPQRAYVRCVLMKPSDIDQFSSETQGMAEYQAGLVAAPAPIVSVKKAMEDVPLTAKKEAGPSDEELQHKLTLSCF